MLGAKGRRAARLSKYTSNSRRGENLLRHELAVYSSINAYRRPEILAATVLAVRRTRLVMLASWGTYADGGFFL